MGTLVRDKNLLLGLLIAVFITSAIAFLVQTNVFANASKLSEGGFVADSVQIASDWRVTLKSPFGSSPLNFSGVNVNSQILDGKVVWERQVGGTWQIFYFDGVKVSSITNSALPNLFPIINQKYIAWVQKVTETEWHIQVYSLAESRSATFAKLDKAWPIEFTSESTIRVKSEGQEYPEVKVI